jgi:ribosomal protein S18 acetylase RimI-like enzyme
VHFTLRPAGADDAALLRRLFDAERAPDFAHLDAPLRSTLLDMQYRAMTADRAARYPQAADRVIELDGAPVGRLLVDRSTDTTTLVDVALLPAARGRGLGGALLTALCAEGRPVTLRVLADNPARRLYTRLGFEPVGEAPPYLQMRFVPGGHAGDPST